MTTYWLWRLLKEVVIHYGERIARRSESRVDDVLLPIVNQFAPIVLFVIGGAAILQELGIRLDALLVAIGGAAFILAFALQDILSNVFSGLSLLVDTPFRYGDLIRLEDGTVCQVVRIGVRVTQLYDIDTHAILYMPNSKLANERLVNLMQPTPELISSIRLELARETDVERTRDILNAGLEGHPDPAGGEAGARAGPIGGGARSGSMPGRSGCRLGAPRRRGHPQRAERAQPGRVQGFARDDGGAGRSDRPYPRRGETPGCLQGRRRRLRRGLPWRAPGGFAGRPHLALGDPLDEGPRHPPGGR